jgi:glycosyltransferase involved in cell wall biosynthesis
MKIAIFHNLLPGGAKRVVYEEVKRLHKNHEITLFRYNTTDESYMDIRNLVSEVITYNFELSGHNFKIINRLERDYRNFILLSRLNYRIAEDIDKLKFDACLIHPDVYTQAPFLLRFLKTPSLYYCEELLRIAYEKELDVPNNLPLVNKIYERSTRKIRKIIDRDNATKANRILVSSKYIARKVKYSYGKEAYICRLGVDTEIFKAVAKKKNNYVLFMGSRKDEINGYQFALKVLKIVPKKYNLKLVRVLPKQSKLVLNDRDIAKLYSTCFVTICTSQNEPFGLTSIESMACGTPVIAVNDGGYKETVIDGKNGFLVDRNINKFAELITKLVSNRQLSERMGRMGREYVKKYWSWDRHSSEIEKHLVNISKIT